jgi:hypothetical protein
MARSVISRVLSCSSVHIRFLIPYLCPPGFTRASKERKPAAFHGHICVRLVIEVDKLLVGYYRAGDHGACLSSIFHDVPAYRVITGVMRPELA